MILCLDSYVIVLLKSVFMMDLCISSILNISQKITNFSFKIWAVVPRLPGHMHNSIHRIVRIIYLAKLLPELWYTAKRGKMLSKESGCELKYTNCLIRASCNHIVLRRCFRESNSWILQFYSSEKVQKPGTILQKYVDVGELHWNQFQSLKGVSMCIVVDCSGLLCCLCLLLNFFCLTLPLLRKWVMVGRKDILGRAPIKLLGWR